MEVRVKIWRVLFVVLVLFLALTVVTHCSKSSEEGRKMIHDNLKNAEKYYDMHPRFKQAFAYLKQESLADIPDGKYEIDGDRIFAMIQKGMGQPKSEAKLESHRKYIDIQYVISGTDEMGWKPTSSCKSVDVPYDAEKDIGFFKDEPQTWTKVEPGYFTIFTPDDAHAPMISDGEIRKVVIKVMKDMPPWSAMVKFAKLLLK
jgi:YhcH/YjgK/YiaL family protein